MVKFYVDAFADMFGEELEQNGLFLAPSKIKKCRSIIDFKGYKKTDKQSQIYNDINAGKYKVIPLTKAEWVEFFKKDLDNGDDVVFFSVSFNLLEDKGDAIKSAFAELNKLYPNNKAILVDTKTVSRGTSEIAGMTSLVFQKSNNIDEALDFAETLIGKFVSLFAIAEVDNFNENSVLKDLLKNFPGTILNIKPILSIDTEGKIRILDKAKGFKSAVSKLYSNTKMNGENIADYTFTVVYLNAEEEATALYNRFRELVSENEIRLVPLSLNNSIKLGKKCVGLTFHSKY